MDANLLKIADANRFSIRNGSIGKACDQAEDYLTYILGHNYETIQEEMDEFVVHVKKMRRRNRGKRKEPQGQAHKPHVQRTEAPAPSSA